MPTKLEALGVEPSSENIARLREWNIMKNNITEKTDLERLDIAFQEII